MLLEPKKNGRRSYAKGDVAPESAKKQQPAASLSRTCEGKSYPHGLSRSRNQSGSRYAKKIVKALMGNSASCQCSTRSVVVQRLLAVLESLGISGGGRSWTRER